MNGRYLDGSFVEFWSHESPIINISSTIQSPATNLVGLSADVLLSVSSRAYALRAPGHLSIVENLFTRMVGTHTDSCVRDKGTPNCYPMVDWANLIGLGLRLGGRVSRMRTVRGDLQPQCRTSGKISRPPLLTISYGTEHIIYSIYLHYIYTSDSNSECGSKKATAAVQFSIRIVHSSYW